MGKDKSTIRIDKLRCKGCGLCIPACPKGMIHLAGEVDARGIRVACADMSLRCNGCALCYVICPDTAITVYRSSNSRESKEGA